MASQALVSFLFAIAIVISTVRCNSEVEVLSAWRATLVDPNNVLQSWNATLVNPCTWFHITCNGDNSVTRVDLGNAGLGGALSPLLGNLTNLQYLEVYANNFTGTIPATIGHLTSLVSLDLYNNQLSGPIPGTLGNLKSLWFMRLNNNNLSGILPAQVIDLVSFGNLRILNVANNSLAGTVHSPNSTGYVVTTIIQDPRAKNA